MSPKTKRRIDKETLERLIRDTEALQLEIVGGRQTETAKEERREEKELVKIGSLVSIYLPETRQIKVERTKNRLLLKKMGQKLEIWLDSEDGRAISIGDIDYYITKEGKLIEIEEGGLWDILPKRKLGSKDYQLTQDEQAGWIVELRVIEGNKTVDGFFKKQAKQ